MENFLLIDDYQGHVTILDKCLASSTKSAQQIFDNRGWVLGDVIAEADYMHEMKQSQMEMSLELGEQ